MVLIEKQRKPKAYKGSVLFTVLVVMVVMLIVMLTTIALAGTASKRAYSEYNDHQTTTTAQSLVDSVVYSLGHENKTIGTTIVNNLKASKGSVSLDVGNLGEGFGVVDSLVLTYVGLDNDTDFNLTGTGKPIIRITATVTQGGVTSTYSQYAIGDVTEDSSTSSGGGFIALGGYNGKAKPGFDSNSPMYIGVKDAVDSSNKEVIDTKKTVLLSNPNDGYLSAMSVNSSATLKTNMKVHLGAGEGLTIMGNLFNNAGAAKFETFNTLSNYKSNFYKSNFSTDKNAYIYVGGTFDIRNGLALGIDENGNKVGTDDNSPMDVYCGRLVLKNQGYIAGLTNIYCYNESYSGESNPYSPSHAESDVYIYDSLSDDEIASWETDSTKSTLAENYAKSSWSVFGSDKRSNLIDWAAGITGAADYKTGSYYTKGNLIFDMRNGGTFNLAGDMYVKGDLVIKTQSDMNGSKLIGGNLYVEGAIKQLDGTSADPLKLIGAVSGKIYNNYLYNNLTAEQKASTEYENIKAYPGSGLPTQITDFTANNGSKSKSVVETNTVTKPSSVKKQFYTIDSSGNETFTKAVDKSNAIIGKDFMIVKSGSSTRLNGSNVYKDGAQIPDTGAPTVTGFTYDILIEESCALVGEFSGKNIYICPKAGTTEFWINVHHLKLTNESKILINDDVCKVNFFIPDNAAQLSIDATEVTASDYDTAVGGYEINFEYWDREGTKHEVAGMNGIYADKLWLYTKDYYDHKGSLVGLETYPTGTNKWMIPNVGIYAEQHSAVYIYVANDLFATADLCAPGAIIGFYTPSRSSAFEGTFTYNSRTVSGNNKTSWIGSIIVDTIDIVDNDFSLCYVDYPSSAPPEGDEDGEYEWNVLSGFGNY